MKDNKTRHFQIAIDGPVAAGKGTASKKLAEVLGFLYVDTGATYRVATLLAMRQELDFSQLDIEKKEEVERLVELVERADILMNVPKEGEKDGRLITVKLNGEDVSWAIREESVSAKVFVVAKLARVRDALVKKQQKIAKGANVVMEGRDITYRVLPDADLKIYLTASEEVRVRRRCEQLTRQGRSFDPTDVERDLKKRDEIDKSRDTDPLQIVEGAWVLDTSELSIDETVEKIVGRVREMRKIFN